jgi:hypothetical protein
VVMARVGHPGARFHPLGELDRVLEVALRIGAASCNQRRQAERSGDGAQGTAGPQAQSARADRGPDESTVAAAIRRTPIGPAQLQPTRPTRAPSLRPSRR